VTALRATIWLSVLAWVAGECTRSLRPKAASLARWAWSMGALAALVHSALAFHLHHGWSHAAAYADTARQVAALTGFAFGAGIFANYAFLAAWTADVTWWWSAPGSFARRPRGIDRALRGFLWFMFLNGAVVFAHGPRRWLGAVAVTAVAGAWYVGAGAPESSRQ
jgi:hypothetical protein